MESRAKLKHTMGESVELRITGRLVQNQTSLQMRVEKQHRNLYSKCVGVAGRRSASQCGLPLVQYSEAAFFHLWDVRPTRVDRLALIRIVNI
jgi:hypothetical protein